MIIMNQTVVITGAGGVLCSSFAKAMAKTGAPIALLDLNAAAAETVAEEIRKDGGKAKAYGVNVLEVCRTRTTELSKTSGNVEC